MEGAKTAMKETRMGKDYCPNCNHLCDSATGEHIPKPGDISVCFYCGAYLQFSNDMALVLLPEVIYQSLPPETKQILKQARIAILNRIAGEKASQQPHL